MLITQCPHCNTVFAATVELLMRAGGRTRCGHCHEAFDALINLRDRFPDPPEPSARPPGFSLRQIPRASGVPAPAAGESPAEIRTLSSSPPERLTRHRGEPVFDLSDLPPLDEDDLVVASNPVIEALEEQGFVAHPPDPDTAMPQEPSRLGGMLAWGTGSILLTLALLAQGMLSRDAIAGFPPLKSFAAKVCDLTGCTRPLPRETASLNLVSRDVQPHPSVAGALLISATMINRASFPQEWPMLEITLADLNGRLLTMRRFGPEIYLSSDMDIATGMPPDTPIHVVFETEDPGDDAVAFEFRFR